jgi:dienelactone hydrolase
MRWLTVALWVCAGLVMGLTLQAQPLPDNWQDWDDSRKEELFLERLAVKKQAGYEILYAEAIFDTWKNGPPAGSRRGFTGGLNGALKQLESSFPNRVPLSKLSPAPNEIKLVQKIPPRNESEVGLTAHNIVYLSDGLKVRGLLVKPKGDGPFPLIVYNHGGGPNGLWEQNRRRLYEWAQLGYVCIGSSYRGTIGPAGESEGELSVWNKEVNDVIRLTELAKQLPYVDPTRIGMQGGSRGAGLSLNLITKYGDFTCLVTMYPAAAIDPENSERPQPIYSDVAAIRSDLPLLIISGRNDPMALFKYVKQYMDRLDSIGKSYQKIIYDGYGHGSGNPKTDAEADMHIQQFFAKWLKPSQ